MGQEAGKMEPPAPASNASAPAEKAATAAAAPAAVEEKAETTPAAAVVAAPTATVVPAAAPATTEAGASAAEAVVEGELVAGVSLQLDERSGVWRTAASWRLPPAAPPLLDGARLSRIRGQAALPASLAEMAAVLRPGVVHHLTFALPAADAKSTPPPAAPEAAPAPAAPSPAPAAPAEAAPSPAPAAPVTTAKPAEAAAVPVVASSSASSSTGGGGGEGQRLVVNVQGDEGEPPGIKLDDGLRITKVDAGGLLEGKVRVGDVVLSLNGIKMTERDEFMLKWRRLVTDAQVELLQKEGAEAAILASRLPEEAEKLIVRKPNCHYFLENVEVTGTQTLGLALETLVNRVVVVRVRDGSVGAGKFKRWDILLAVDRIRVSDAAVAKHLIRDRAGKFEALMERGSETYGRSLEKALEAKRSAAATAEDDDWGGSFGGPPDVQAIVATAIPDRRQRKPSPGILRRSSSTRPVAISADPPQETEIVSDTNPNKKLRRCPRLS